VSTAGAFGSWTTKGALSMGWRTKMVSEMKPGRQKLLGAISMWFFVLFLCHTPVSAAVIRVKPVSAGGNDNYTGQDWNHAKATVQGAISAAAAGDQIWVAAGTYEERIHNRVVNDQAVNVALYGGFAGTENDLSERNWNINSTILDGTGSGTVVTITGGAGPETRLDGFYITRGLGGISISNSAPNIENNTVKENTGPGITIVKYKIVQIEPPVVEHPTITANSIVDNVSDNGAGIVVAGDLLTNLIPPPPSSPVITRNIIARNTAAQNGGGIGCWGHTAAVISDNYILANSATFYEPGWDGDDPVGPWLVGGGGIFASKRDMGGTPVQYAICAPLIINNVVAANGALLGGGICIVDYPLLSEPNNPPPVVTNNTVVANNGSGIYWGDTFPTVRNNLVAFNTWGLQQDQSSSPTLGYNNVYGNMVQGGKSDYQGIADQTGVNGNISADPEMANYRVGDFHLQPGSACIDAGLLDAVEIGWTDVDGQNRVIGGGVDIGADESDGTSWNTPVPIIHVRSAGGDDTKDGLTWAAAKSTVTGGIAEAAKTGGEVWVAAGTYLEHIAIPAFVYLYGGFDGTETDRDERDFAENITILDGDGVPTVVLSMNAGYLVSTLDGFTVQNGGVYRGPVIPQVSWGVEGRGGGVRSAVTGLYISNNTIRRNSFGNPFDNANRRGHGAGIHGYLSHSVIHGNMIEENEILNTFDGSGAGIYFKLSMPLIEENTITQNHARYGSAIYCLSSIPKIVENVIEDNAMYDSYPLPLYFGSVEGAITLDQGEDFLIEGNVIAGNKAAIGAGINVKTNLAGRIQNNLILNNTAYDPTASGGMGGGIYCLVPTTAVENTYILNNTIVGNTATYALFQPPLNEEGGGIAISLPPPVPIPETLPPGKLTLANNIIAFNSSGIFETLTSPMIAPSLLNNDVFNSAGNYLYLSAGPTDLSEDPVFVDRDGPDDDPGTIDDNDYHLSANSPCIDSGTGEGLNLPATDFEGQVRVFDGDGNGTAIVDIGADELVLPVQGDFDGDGDVDLSDMLFILQLLSGQGQCPNGCETADVNGDGRVDMKEAICALQKVCGLR
jgi:hypothetical protein